MVYSNVIEHDGPSYIEYIYMDMRNYIISEDVGFYEKKICLMNEYAIEKEVPSSYDFDIYTELHYGNNDYVPYYGRSNYPGDDSGSGISVGLPFSVIESDKLYKSYLNQMELRWLKTQGEKEIWRRVQERFQWD
ncbi:hypothetical protein [Saccharibacter floricola]|uniref:Uncharacterized protein n=1 Tax=Saccharibacter floricola DSM 15669 TaxID=1123227 RepID=A0ABQ0P137_9PROT|nr:hypothetical protein [Saccharibacter floricola]GBQ08799.1 hypothetical protein AA15669_1914 [Saccharibacter floricola DSM 15669]